MKQLIVNADDFGYTCGVNRAIIDGYRSGIITSTSLMSNGAALEAAIELARVESGLDIGCHVNLVEGAPLSPPDRIPHLVEADGKFHSLSGLVLRLVSGLVPSIELERECSAQIEKLLGLGIQPTHLDTQKHIHLHPRVAAAVAAVARHYSVHWLRRPFENAKPPQTNESGFRNAIRRSLNLLGSRFEHRMSARGIRLPDFFTGFGMTGRWTKPAMEATLDVLAPGLTELMCHPGYYDADLEAAPTLLKRERQVELEILIEIRKDPAWQARLSGQGIVLRGFRDLPSAPAKAVRSAPARRGPERAMPRRIK